jgi:hypothetical protein
MRLGSRDVNGFAHVRSLKAVLMNVQKPGWDGVFASARVCHLSRAAGEVGRVSGREGVRRRKWR